LGNTPAISRKSYVHPALLAAVKDDPRDPLQGMERPSGKKRLSSGEVALLEFLARGTKRGARRTAANRRVSHQQQAAA
jgi:DNA topoisomerase-1